MNVRENVVASWLFKLKQDYLNKSEILELRDFIQDVNQILNQNKTIDEAIQALPSLPEFLDVLCVHSEILADKQVATSLVECFHSMTYFETKTETEKIASLWAWKHITYLLKIPIQLDQSQERYLYLNLIHEKVMEITAALQYQFNCSTTTTLTSAKLLNATDMSAAMDCFIPLLGTSFSDEFLQQLFLCTDQFHNISCYSQFCLSAIESSLSNLSMKTTILFYERWPEKYILRLRGSLLAIMECCSDGTTVIDLKSRIAQSEMVKYAGESALLMTIALKILEEVCRSSKPMVQKDCLQTALEGLLQTLGTKVKEFGLESGTIYLRELCSSIKYNSQ
uniref:Uncharacterized protein n=1 Tax=Ciona savignyi TaxID=51511 RepID=H2Z0L9_CIOSA